MPDKRTAYGRGYMDGQRDMRERAWRAGCAVLYERMEATVRVRAQSCHCSAWTDHDEQMYRHDNPLLEHLAKLCQTAVEQLPLTPAPKPPQKEPDHA